MAKTAVGAGDGPDRWNQGPFGKNPYYGGAWNARDTSPDWNRPGGVPNGRDVDPGWNRSDDVPNGRDIDPGFYRPGPDGREIDPGFERQIEPWGGEPYHRGGGYDDFPSAPGSGYEGKPSYGKFHKMNGIKAPRPGKNRADFGPQNDNYDDRL